MTVYEIPLKDGLQEIVAKAIQENGSDTELSTLFNSAISCASAIIESVRQSDPPLQSLACEAGCAHCCYQYDVGATPFEVLHIATTILETYTEDERERLFARLATAEQRKQAHSLEDWGTAKYPCPLLVDEKCSVYETRPFVCRAMNSYDGDRCRVNRETPRNDSSVPMYSHQYDIAKFARTGIQQGLLDAGLQNDILELVPALRIALTTPDALIRWLSGEKVFEEAVSRLPPRSGQLQRGSQNNELPESDDGTPQTRSNAL
jgi:uncharacterized protein